MTPTDSNLQVAVRDSIAFVKVHGRATFAIATPFKELFHELRERSFKRYVLDLSECPLMDSTFLGVIARITMDLDGQRQAGAAPAITLLNPNRKVADLLDNLGVLGTFCVLNGSFANAENYKARELGEVEKREVTSTCLEAHKALCEINPANLPKFKDVIRFFEEDLKRQEG